MRVGMTCDCEGVIFFTRFSGMLICCFCKREITPERLHANGYVIAPDGLPIRVVKSNGESFLNLERH